MLKNLLIIGLTTFLLGCGSSTKSDQNMQEDNKVAKLDMSEVADSILHFRHELIKTDFLDRTFPDLARDEAIQIQLRCLEKELANGEQQAGWKMGGTVGDSAAFDPIMGYMLTRYQNFPGDHIRVKQFPGAEVMVEGEVGFVFKQDFPNGVKSMEELINGIDYAIGAVEFAQAIALGLNNNPATLKTNHNLAFGTGQAGFILGNKKIPISEFTIQEESVECFVDGKSAASGSSSRIYKGHLNALNSLVNLLPQYGLKIKKGDVVITGSMYKNPIITGNADVKLHFTSLGDIEIKITD